MENVTSFLSNLISNPFSTPAGQLIGKVWSILWIPIGQLIGIYVLVSNSLCSKFVCYVYSFIQIFAFKKNINRKAKANWRQH